MKDTTIISHTLMELARYYITTQIPFTVNVVNDPIWDLPSYLNNLNGRVQFDMKNTDLEESYVNVNGELYLTVGIDDIVRTLHVESHHLHAIGPLGNFLVVKQFKEKPSVEKFIKGSLGHSMQCMVINNPEWFPTTPGAA